MYLRKYFEKTKWINGFIFCLGVILILLSEYLKLSSTSAIIYVSISHLGTAFVIASIIGIYLELTEVKEFFEQRLINIISSDEYIDLVSEDKLIDLNINTMRGLGRRRINNELYDYSNFVDLVCYDLLDNIGKPYRKDYYETIDYRILKPEEITELGIDAEQLKKDRHLVQITSKTKYQLISPKEDEVETFPIELFWHVTPIPGLEPSKQITFEIIIENEKLKLPVSNFIKDEKDRISFDFEHKIKFLTDKSIEIIFSYYDYERYGLYDSYMEALTNNVTIHFSSNVELKLEAEVFGMTENYNEPSITSNSVSIQHPGWILPGHGYYITWEKK